MHNDITKGVKRIEQLIPTYHNEYLLAAAPDEEVRRKLQEEKEWFWKQYKHEPEKCTKPHITIARFFAREMMEETLIRWIQRICNLQKSFVVTLNNYSGIPVHTIYWRIQDTAPFRQLTSQLKMLDGFLECNGCPPVIPGRTANIPLAQALPDQIYHRAILEYTGKSFHESFAVSRLYLYKCEEPQREAQLLNTFALPSNIMLPV